MAISYLGNKDTQDTFTLGSSASAVVNGQTGTENDIVRITKYQTATVNATSDDTQTLVFEAGIKLQSVQSNAFGTKVVFVNADNTTTTVQANASNTFQVGSESFTADEFVTWAAGKNIADGTEYEILGTEGAADFAISANVTAVNEGSTVTISIANAVAGEDYSYTLTGVAAADVAGDLTGTVRADKDGNGTLQITLNADATTEGAETLTVTINGETVDVTVNDTSETPASHQLDLAVDSTLAVTEDDANNASRDAAVTDTATVTSDAISGGSLTVSSSESGDINLDGVNAYLDSNEEFVIVNIAGTESVIGTVGSDFGDSYVSVNFNSDVTAAQMEALIKGLTYEAHESGSFDLTLSLYDGTATISKTIEGTAVAEETFTIADLDTDLVVTARTDSAVAIDLSGNAAINTGNSDQANISDFEGGTMTITLGGATTDANDQLSFTAAGAATAGIRMIGDQIIRDTDGTDTNAAGNEQVVGTLSGDGTAASPFSITFAEGVTDADIEYLLNNLKFDTSDDAAIGERTVTVTISDADGINTDSATTNLFVVNEFMSLTAANDTGADFTGTSETDAYQAANDALDSGDVLDGGEGTDFLLAELTETSVAPTVNNVEQFRLSANDADASNKINLANVTHDTDGAVTVNVDGKEDLVMTGVDAAVGKIDLSGLGGTSNITLTSGNGALDFTGSDQTDTLVMSTTLNNEDSIDGGAGSGDSVSATVNGLDATTGVLDIDNVETITLTASTADSTVDASGIDGTGVSIQLSNTSDANLVVTNIGESITAITNADAASSVTATFAEDADVTLTGSTTGNIVANMGSTLDGADTFTTAGGAADVLSADFDGASEESQAIAIAATAVAFANGDATVTISLSDTSALTVGEFVTFGTISVADNAHADLVAAAAALSNQTLAVATISAGANFTVELASATGGSAAGSSTAASAEYIDTSVDGNTLFNVDNVETFNLSNTNNASTFNFKQTIVDTLNIDGDADVTISQIEDATTTTIDASDGATGTGSTFTGNLTLDVDVAADHTITGGQGDDEFNLTATATIDSNDAITGGDGADTLNATLATGATIINIDEVETVNLDITAGTTSLDLSSVDGDGTNAVSVTFTDSGTDSALTFDNVDTTINSIDLSGLNGTVTVGQNADTTAADTGNQVGATDDETGTQVTISADVAGVRTIKVTSGALVGGVSVGDQIDLSGLTLQEVTANAGPAVLATTDTDSDGTTDAQELQDYLLANVFTVTAADNTGVTFEINTSDLAETDVAATAADVEYWDAVDATDSDFTGDGVVTVQAAATGATNTAVISGTGANVLMLGAGDDQITISDDSNGDATLTSADVINAFGGTDTLTAKIADGAGALDIANVENLNLEATEALTLDLSGVTHNTAGGTTLGLSGGQEVTLQNPGAAIGTISTTSGVAAGIIVELGNDSSRDLDINLGTGQPDTFTFAADFGGNSEHVGTVTITGFEAAGTTDRIIINDTGNTDADAFQNIDLKFTNYDSDNDGTNDSVRINLISGASDASEGTIELIGLLSSDIAVGDDIVLA